MRGVVLRRLGSPGGAGYIPESAGPSPMLFPQNCPHALGTDTLQPSPKSPPKLLETYPLQHHLKLIYFEIEVLNFRNTLKGTNPRKLR